MGTSLISPQANPNPMPSGPLTDPATGSPTDEAFWYLHSLRNSAQTALDGTVATVLTVANGADNAASLNAAILALIKVGGGALQLTAGNYPVSSPIVFPAGFNGRQSG